MFDAAGHSPGFDSFDADEDCIFPGLGDLIATPQRCSAEASPSASSTRPVLVSCNSVADTATSPMERALELQSEMLLQALPTPQRTRISDRCVAATHEESVAEAPLQGGPVWAGGGEDYSDPFAALQAEVQALREEAQRLRSAEAAAVREAARLRRRVDGDAIEVEELRARLDTERRLREASSASSMDACDDRLVKRLAAIELTALAGIEGADDRAKIRRRLQLRWHPDKNAHCVDFSKNVLQEMQKLPQWR